MIASPWYRPSHAALLVLVCGLSAGCRKKTPRENAPPPAAAPDSAAQAAPTADGPPAWLENVKATPGATVLTALDPKKMSPNEVQFGVAPKLSKEVEYQPDVIIMEQGDKAIRSVASDGMTWKFDANAPHVSEFQEGRIVFATGRAVGRIMGLKRDGQTVSAVLGPIQLTDVIKNGKFVMNQEVDPDKMIAYVAPDFPGSTDSGSTTQTSSRGGPGDDGVETVVVSRVSRGRWTPTSMSQTYGDGRRITYRRDGSRWVEPHLSATNRWPPRMPNHDDLAVASGQPQGLPLPGMPQGLPQPINVPKFNIPPTTTAGAVPTVNIGEGDLRIENVANNSAVGLQYYYYSKSSGLGASASGLVSLHRPEVRCVLSFANGQIDSAGISIKGAAGVKLSLDAHSPKETFVNFHIKHWVPIDISIPLGGPVPFALTFATLFDLNSGFSAKQSIMAAEGEYTFSGGIWAGRAGGSWSVATPAHFDAVTYLGKSLQGISLGINSLTLGFGIRTMVGLGAFGFNTGVFATVRFGGGLLLAPNEAFPCRQATLETFLDSGIGYQTPQWVSSAINFFLKPLTGHTIDAVGTIAAAPSRSLFREHTEIPSGCSTPKSG